MRTGLHNLVKMTIIYKYDLPNAIESIPKTLFSAENDKCYSIANEQDLVKLIYNSIIDYSFEENNNVGLWFGETKFYIDYKSAVNEVLKKSNLHFLMII